MIPSSDLSETSALCMTIMNITSKTFQRFRGLLTLSARQPNSAKAFFSRNPNQNIKLWLCTGVISLMLMVQLSSHVLTPKRCSRSILKYSGVFQEAMA
jgi:hypothetical protein